VKPSENNSEWLTRKRLIDPKLKAAGWRIVPFNPSIPITSYDRCAVEEFETEHGPADYALCVGGRILGIVEAKKLTRFRATCLRSYPCALVSVTANQQAKRKMRGPFGSPAL
jgi:predicted type IV restriction endonuclease